MKKMLILLAFAAIAFGAFADAGNLLFSFATKGPDYYADGITKVADGEWYALVWTANAEFGGFKKTADGWGTVVEGDDIVLAAPLAENGHCPYVVFQVDSAEKKKDGKYQVFLVDTRDASGKPSKASANNPMIPANFNGAVATTAESSNGQNISNFDSDFAKDWVLDGDGVARITAIKILDETQVVITVSGMHPLRRYTLLSGDDPKDIQTQDIEPLNGDPEGVTKPVDFYVPKEDAKFFKVIQVKDAPVKESANEEVQ